MYIYISTISLRPVFPFSLPDHNLYKRRASVEFRAFSFVLKIVSDTLKALNIFQLLKRVKRNKS